MNLATTATDAAVATKIYRPCLVTVFTIVFNKATGFITTTKHLDNFFYFDRTQIEVVLYPEAVPVVVMKKDTTDC